MPNPLLICFRAVVTASILLAAAVRAQDFPSPHKEATIAQLQAEMASDRLTSVALTQEYLGRIFALDQFGPGLNAVIELNPDALAMARQADALRHRGILLGPLQGIPVLLKDNINTGDKMQTSAGSFALTGMPALQDATVAAKLRAGGAVILGKTNLSEWANFRSWWPTSGWSARGGLTHNPYGLDHSASGSSSGSAAGVSANLSAVALGTETDGSVICPASVCGIVGLKPTVGLTSRYGVVPISHTQDTVGCLARTVADAAVLLGIIQSGTPDPLDSATGSVPLGWKGTGKARPNLPADYTQFLDVNGLQGAAIGVTRQGVDNAPPQVVAAFDAAVASMASAGATIIDLDAQGFSFAPGSGEYLVLCFDLRSDLDAYFKTRQGVPVAGGTLADAIAFNKAHASVEMPYFGQEWFEFADSLAPGPDDPQPAFGGMTYNQALASDQQSGTGGIDLALSTFNLDAVVVPTLNPAWANDLLLGDRYFYGNASTLAATPGYPAIQVPAGMALGLPVGITFLGTAFSEPKLIKLASGFEAVTRIRINNLPKFPPTPFIQGMTGPVLKRPH